MLLASAFAVGLPVPVASTAPRYHKAVTQVVDANIASAIGVRVRSDVKPLWSSTGTELVNTLPLVSVRSNVDYAFVENASVAGVSLSVTCTSDGAPCPRKAPATTAAERDFTTRMTQSIDYGVPLAVDATGWSVVLVYTFLPATL